MGVRIWRNKLVGLLEESLGRDEAQHLIVKTAGELGLGTFDFSEDEATKVLEVLKEHEGLVGMAATLALSRLPRLVRKEGSRRMTLLPGALKALKEQQEKASGDGVEVAGEEKGDGDER